MSSSKTITKTKSNLPLLTEQNLNTIEEQLVNGVSLQEILTENKNQYPFSLMKFYAYLKKNPELEQRITEARKLGIQTLIDKLMQVFSLQEVENPNQILWIREKSKWVQWLASKLTDIYSDNKPTKQNVDQSIKISWSDNHSELIDVSADVVENSNDKSNP